MSAASPELKAELQKRGLWRDFLHLRDEAKLGGMSPADARKSAVEKLAPELAGMVHLSVGRPKAGASDSLASRKATVAKADERRKEAAARLAEALDDITPETFAGRDASVGVSMKWVISNLGFPAEKVDLRSAPSVLAYSVFVQCQKSPALVNDLVTRMLQKMLAKEDEEEQFGGEKWDGRGEYDLAGVIGGYGGSAPCTPEGGGEAEGGD